MDAEAQHEGRHRHAQEACYRLRGRGPERVRVEGEEEDEQEDDEGEAGAALGGRVSLELPTVAEAQPRPITPGVTIPRQDTVTQFLPIPWVVPPAKYRPRTWDERL